jgi:predicted nucleic acid-binding Zn ribbon protein
MNTTSVTQCTHCSRQITSIHMKRHEDACLKNLFNIKYCLSCNMQIFTKNKFCGHSCSAIYNNSRRTVNRSYMTTEWRQNISDKNKQNWLEGKLTYSNKRLFSSKKEREIVKHFKEKFVSDEWKSGGRLKLAENVFLSRDMWSDKLGICFEYDGIWYFKDIKGQLKMKQYKDALLEEWCVKNNYRLIRIDENHFKNVSQIELLVYNNTQQVVKIGERY